MSTVSRLRDLYDGESEAAHRFRYAILAFDFATIGFVVFTSFVERRQWIAVVDVVIGLLLLADFTARTVIDRNRLRTLSRPIAWADIASIASFLAPLAGEGFGFLRVLRTLRLLHTYQLLRRLRTDFRYFREQEEVILATAHLIIFLFLTTGLIYTLQHDRNPDIGNYADALYFTVTTLTTTGFGDITLEGTGGRLLSVGVMIVGVTLFLRLAQVMFRPTKVRQECETCGLILHDVDAVHCKHCGTTIRIRTEGTY